MDRPLGSGLPRSDSDGTRPISVLVADPNEVVRRGLHSLLTEDGRFTLVEDAGFDIVATAQRSQPDLIVIDPIKGAHIDLSIIAQLHVAAPEARLVIRTVTFEPHSFVEAMLLRVHGYLLKGDDARMDLLAETLAIIGRFSVTVVDAAIAECFWSIPGIPITVHGPRPDAPELTAREREVLLLVIEGLSDKAVATKLRLSISTIDYHLRRLRQKLAVQTRTQLVAAAIDQGFYAPSPAR